MIIQHCNKHRKELQDAAKEAGLPETISIETHGHLPEQEIYKLLLAYAKLPVDESGCSDCRILSQTVFK
jgi:hypothetical protein